MVYAGVEEVGKQEGLPWDPRETFDCTRRLNGLLSKKQEERDAHQDTSAPFGRAEMDVSLI